MGLPSAKETVSVLVPVIISTRSGALISTSSNVTVRASESTHFAISSSVLPWAFSVSTILSKYSISDMAWPVLSLPSHLLSSPVSSVVMVIPSTRSAKVTPPRGVYCFLPSSSVSSHLFSFT